VPFNAADASTAIFLAVLPPSSRIDSSSGASSISSRMGETVPTTRRLFSIDRTSSSRFGLSSSSSPSSASGSALDAPRFLLPSCGVAVCCLGVLLRFEPLLRWTDALRCLCADPFAARGVPRIGVRRDDGCGGSEACLAGRAPRAPKLNPNDAWTEEGLARQYIHAVKYIHWAYPAPRTRC
jgi:hypothetical protein